jgi:CubicO group peptidase (beta-lactamase class C family)
MKILRKLIKYGLRLTLILFIGLNLFILITGKTYIYKGFASTYLKGHIQPTIYELDEFNNRVVSKGDSQNWKEHPKLNSIKLSAKGLEFIEKFDPASFLIAWGDTLIFEKYWGKHNESKLGNSFSMSKSIVSLLIGSAIQDGYITSIDEPVANYLESFKTKSEITIRHLLTMSSGLSWQENYISPFSDVAKLYYDTDAKDLTLNTRTIEEKPGQVFDYKSGDTQTLMYVLKAATKKNVSDYASEKIWSKIGAESDALWNLVGDVNSEEKSFCCLYATTRDFAKLGKLINQNGHWNNEQLIDSNYVKEFKSLAPLNKKDGIQNQCYGFQHWIYTGLPYQVSYFRGLRSQYIISIPKFDLVIVRTGSGSGAKWENTAKRTSNAMLGHNTDLPTYIEIALAVLSQVK